MLFQEPGRTGFDLTFNLLGFPVRVHPAFFILPLLLGGSMVRSATNLTGQEINTGVGLIVLAAVFFVSILIHELGHTLAFRYYGQPSRILLYWMGGLAIPDQGGWNAGRARAFTPEQQIVISFAGPLAGFLLAAAFAGGVYLCGGTVEYLGLTMGFIPLLMPDPTADVFAQRPELWLFFFVGLWANIFWNVLNLAPIYPLDGGQITRQLFVKFSGPAGIRTSLMVAVAFGVFIVVYALSRENRDMFLAFFFGYLAFTNYQMLQQYSNFGGGRW